MKKHFILGIAALLIVSVGLAQKKNAGTAGKAKMLAMVSKDLRDATAQYLYFCSRVPADRFPKTLDKAGKLVTSDSKWWCSGFYPGTLLYLHEANQNDSLYNEAIRKMKLLEGEQYNKGTHDIGFMMYDSYGIANRLQPNAAYKKILVNSAKSLSTRYSPVTGCIRSWKPKRENDYIVIIDNMMNLELLFYATRVTGDSSFYKIAVSHADKTMQNHFRPDYSSFHVVDYNPQTGAVDNRRTHQGAADGSAWARGQGWALYGYTMMYRETKNPKYLNLANNVANFILHHPNLPVDMIPYWDFNAPNIPQAPRDASAGALFASALLELSTYSKGNKAKEYVTAAEKMLTSLSGPEYKVPFGECEGFLLKHSVGSLPHKAEVDVPISYADYYYVEALVRYKKMMAGKPLI
jgi:unsaturated chondroitin disaccharide hydrolase